MTNKYRLPFVRDGFRVRKGMTGAVFQSFVCPICGENHSKAEHPAEHISPSMPNQEKP